ncbi:hypothetical protein DFH09DRAFT_1162584 [Mycena vulgaris]|nr:hypothetical protein DFH09DRAFT_1162584 [Mycena vulgaris]
MYKAAISVDSASDTSSIPSTPSTEHPSSPGSTGSSSTRPLETVNDVLESVLKVRKTWKISRGGDTVWPVELEARLLEALEKYQPDDSRETRMLGRFPRRNRFISDYIFEKTGKRRTPKQIGSRLQQLRESCGGKKLLRLLSPFRTPIDDDSDESPLHSPISPIPADSLLSTTSSARHSIIYINILASGFPHETWSTTDDSSWADGGEIVHASDHPRSLGSINPTVAFKSRLPLIAHSRFRVYSEGLVLHSETVPLARLPQPPNVSAVLYSTQLVPKYWKVILHSPDPTRFTIFHEVVKKENAFVAFSATYQFRYPRDSLQCAPSLQLPWISAGPHDVTSRFGPRYPIYDVATDSHSELMYPYGQAKPKCSSPSFDSSYPHFTPINHACPTHI